MNYKCVCVCVRACVRACVHARARVCVFRGGGGILIFKYKLISSNASNWKSSYSRGFHSSRHNILDGDALFGTESNQITLLLLVTHVQMNRE